VSEEQGQDRERRKRRGVLIAVGAAGLIVGAALGASGSDTKTTTETQTVVATHTERVPVVRTRTVVKTRRIVRTHTVTVEATPAADAGGYGGSYNGDSSDDGGGSSYAGMNCSEIGHSFTVTPGSDPEHDADNDGIACESYG